MCRFPKPPFPTLLCQSLPCPCSLEGDEFETDEENLAAWHETFCQKHFWAADVGPATFIGLSTVRFRRWGLWVGGGCGGSIMFPGGGLACAACRAPARLPAASPPGLPTLPGTYCLPRTPLPPSPAATPGACTRCMWMRSSALSFGSGWRRRRRLGGLLWCSRTHPSWAAASRWSRRCTSKTGVCVCVCVCVCVGAVKAHTSAAGWRGTGAAVGGCLAAGVPGRQAAARCQLRLALLLLCEARSCSILYPASAWLQVCMAEPQQQPARIHRPGAPAPQHTPLVQVRAGAGGAPRAQGAWRSRPGQRVQQAGGAGSRSSVHAGTRAAKHHA